MRKVGWGGEHLSLWSWITAGLWLVAPGFPRDGSSEESHRVKMSLWRKSDCSRDGDTLSSPASSTHRAAPCQGVSRGSSSLMHKSDKGCQYLWRLQQELYRGCKTLMEGWAIQVSSPCGAERAHAPSKPQEKESTLW